MINNKDIRRLHQEMSSLFNNSRLTQETVEMLSNKLNDKDMRLFLLWVGNANVYNITQRYK